MRGLCALVLILSFSFTESYIAGKRPQSSSALYGKRNTKKNSNGKKSYGISSRAFPGPSPVPSVPVKESSSIGKVGVVLLAGGKGKRMKAAMPKQFLPLLGKAVFLRSLDVFQSMSPSIISNIVIVLDESSRDEYKDLLAADSRIVWADPGVERQDSVYNGLNHIPDSCNLVAIHDSARPLVTEEEVMNCLKDAHEYGAAVLGVPVKATIKEGKANGFVERTVDRSRLWEIHTPQISTKNTFMRGFDKVKAENLEVTDDVSVIEALGEPVKLTFGEYTNIKLTTPEDIAIAEGTLRERGVTDPAETEGASAKASLTEEPGYPCVSERYRDNLSRPAEEKKVEGKIYF